MKRSKEELRICRKSIKSWMQMPDITREQITEQAIKKFHISYACAARTITAINRELHVFTEKRKGLEQYSTDENGNKVCSSCQKRKNISEFPTKKRRNGKIELYAYCNDCHKVYAKNLYLKSAFNISPEERDLLGNRCMVCGFVPKEGKSQVAVDHDHKTGLVRGRLCSRCNRGLTWFQDKPELFLAMYNYLLNPPAIDILGEKRYGRIGTATGRRKVFKKHQSLFTIVKDE